MKDEQKVKKLRTALYNLLVAADHVGSTVFDWERVLPQSTDEARLALKETE